MIEISVPLLNAQQQAMAPLVETSTKAEVVAQQTQAFVSTMIEEENKQVKTIDAEDKESDTISDRQGSSQGFAGQHKKYPQKNPEADVETSASYHNPLAGFLVNEKV